MSLEDLCIRIKHNRIEDVQRYLSGRIDLEQTYKEYTPLIWAINENRFEMVKLLVARGASINAIRPCWRTPLMQCVDHNNLELAKYLINLNANTCKPDTNGQTPLSLAVDKGNADMVKLLLNNGAKFTIDDTSPYDTRTPLMQCVKSENLELAKYLIDMNANTCKPDKDGATPLSLAVVNENLDMVKLLMENGAQASIDNALLKNGKTPLMQCIQSDNLELANYLIDMMANTCQPDKDGTTPLLLALYRGNIKMINLLLNNGAKSTIDNIFLFEAIRVENDEITKWLLQVQDCTDINVKDPNGDTLFIKCVRLEKFSTVKLLIEKGADVNQRDENGLTALAIALSNLDFHTFQLLIDSGADTNLATKEIQEMAQKNEEFAKYTKSLELENTKNSKLIGTTPVKPDNLATESQNEEGFTGQDEAAKKE